MIDLLITEAKESIEMLKSSNSNKYKPTLCPNFRHFMSHA